MPQLTREAISARRNAIAVVIADRGWSSQVAEQLQQEWGLSRAQVYREKDAVIADLAVELSGVPVEERRAEILEMLRGVIVDARRDRNHAAAISALRLFSRISGVWDTPPPIVIAIDGRQLTGEAAVAQLEERIEAAGLRRGPVIDLSEDDYAPGS